MEIEELLSTKEELANVRGVARHAVGELFNILLVYEDDIPKPVAESLARLREALERAAPAR